MPIELKEVTSKKELKQFIKFPFSLYKGNVHYVPPIIDFELSTLDKKKNPAFDHCEANYWLAYQEGRIVGRIAGIIHGAEFEEKSFVRFGWIDFIDDLEVSSLLLSAVAKWGKSKGATGIHGPLGFTDLDFEGALVSGFDQLATQATIYNYPYYIEHYEKYGLAKAVDWVEVRGFVPAEHSKRLARTASIVSSRFNIEVKKFSKAKQILDYAPGVFSALNESYKGLYGYYPLTKDQIAYYVDQYFGFIRKEYVCIVVNENDEVVGFAITLPSLSKAFQKAKGSLIPFGFYHVLKAFRSNKHLDLFLIGVTPDYQKKGANVLIFNELMKNYIQNGVKYVSTGPMLEENSGVQNLWNEYGQQIDSVDIRRRCFTKMIN